MGNKGLIVAVRLVLLLLAFAAVAVGWSIALRDRGSSSGVRYFCPMHADVVASEPSQCPICGMALEQKGGDSGTRAHGGMGAMTDDVASVENVRKHNVVEFVRRRSLLPHTRELRGGAWVEDDGSISAVFYKDQVDVMEAGERGTFSLTRSTNVVVNVRRTSEAPRTWDESTSQIHFLSDQAEGSKAASPSSPLHAGDVGWLEVTRKPRDVLAIPASAILQSPEGPYVLAWKGFGYQFEKRPVEIGETFAKYGFAVVLAGLRANDRVVSKAAFFLDAERRLAIRGTGGGMGAP